MIFTVYYRDKSGRKASLELDVSTKDEVWPELKKRGISAISITDGTEHKKGCAKPFALNKFFLLGGCLIVALLAVSLFLMGNGTNLANKSKSKTASKEQPHKIKKSKANKVNKTKPQLSKKATAETQPANLAISHSAEVQRPAFASSNRVITNSVAQAVKSKYDVFEHRVEGELAFLACMPIGTMVIGHREFDKHFMDELAKSLESEIKINDDDNEETKYYKQSVIELKKEIRSMMRNGEDVAEALSKSRKELQELGVYKTHLEIQLNELMSKGDEVSDNDIQDFVTAANIMLGEKGIEPFHFNSLTRTILRNKPLAGSEDESAENERSDNE